MSGMRQKLQLELALFAESRGESPTAVDEGTEPVVAVPDPESQVCVGLMEAVVEDGNVARALKRVCSNKGAPGVDGMKVQQLPKYLARHWRQLRQQLLEGTYVPQPVRRVQIPKPGGGTRSLGIPTVLDRLVQQALLQVLQPEWDASFSAHSYGFRPGRSTHQAIAQAQAYIGAGYRWVVDIDLEKFFDRVNHDILMGRVARRVEDKRVLKLVRSFLNSGVLADGLVSATHEGTPQGGPLSPLLSNLLLDDLDRELQTRGLHFVRYADDCNIYVRSCRAGQRVKASITRYLTTKLKLKVNEQKSAVGRPWQRKFLGFSFTGHYQPKRRIAPQSVERFKARVRELTPRNAGRSLRNVVKDLARYLNGWIAHFGFCETPSVLSHLERWVRRRLRCLVWKQWKRGRRRYKELVKRGVDPRDAARTAGSNRALWRLSQTPALCKALPNTLFTQLGLPRLAVRTP